MRFMIIVKATKDSEAGVMPDESFFAEMAKYHEELQRVLQGDIVMETDGRRIRVLTGRGVALRPK